MSPTREKKRWEVFEHDKSWWLIGPSRQTVSSPYSSEAQAREVAKRLNRKDEVIEAFRDGGGDA